MKNPFSKYAGKFIISGFFRSLRNHLHSMGMKTAYSALLLFYAFRRKDTPLYAKNIIAGVLGYLLTPFDGLPDFTPFIGYTDDLGVLTFGLVTVACYVNDEVRIKARKTLKSWFGALDLAQLNAIDKKI